MAEERVKGKYEWKADISTDDQAGNALNRLDEGGWEIYQVIPRAGQRVLVIARRPRPRERAPMKVY